jgi:predicted KAP-like P-loop ATPase
MPEKPTLDFLPERPITSREADLLDRAPFAEQTAAAVRGWTGQDSLVVGLYGEWGTGKSSLKNMVVDSLRADQERSPYIVEFNPWQWAGQDQLAHAFFREIGKVLGKEEGRDRARTRSKLWGKYAALIRLGVEAFAGMRRLIFAALVVIGLLGFAAAFFETVAVRVTLGVIGLLSFIGIVVLKSSERVTRAVAEYFSTVAEAEDESLDEVKNKLSRFLRTLSRPVLVVMDDVDRLTGREIRLLFQLIKANADFPNIVYLVLFQREVVEGILTRELSTDGREYLKKIVQVGFDVPSVQRSRLERVLFSKLNALLQGDAIEKLWEKERWTNIFIDGLGPYFGTLRDVYRFISTLSLHIAVFSKGDSFEVNPIDLISLEVLRVFEPEAFKALPASKIALTNVGDPRLFADTGEAAQEREIRKIVDKAPEQNRKQVEQILKQVFPPASWVFGGSRYGHNFSDIWFRQHRACHPDVFDKYFYMAIPEGDVSHEELEKIVSLAGDRVGLVNELRALGQRNLLEVAMDRLESYKDTIGLDHAIPFVTALFDLGDELPIGEFGISEIPSDMHAARIVYWYLKQEPRIPRREEILRECIEATTGIYLPAFVVALERDKAREGTDEQSRLADDAGVEHLQEICTLKIRLAATVGALAEHPRLGELLSFWQSWSSLDEVREWVRALTESSADVVSFLIAFMRQTRSHVIGEYAVRFRWHIDIETIGRLVDPELIESKLSDLALGTLEGKGKEAVKAFQKALKRKREGKPAFSPFEDE